MCQLLHFQSTTLSAPEPCFVYSEELCFILVFFPCCKSSTFRRFWFVVEIRKKRESSDFVHLFIWCDRKRIGREKKIVRFLFLNSAGWHLIFGLLWQKFGENKKKMHRRLVLPPTMIERHSTDKCCEEVSKGLREIECDCFWNRSFHQPTFRWKVAEEKKKKSTDTVPPKSTPGKVTTFSDPNWNVIVPKIEFHVLAVMGQNRSGRNA